MRLTVVGYVLLSVIGIGMLIFVIRLPKVVWRQRMQTELDNPAASARSHLGNLFGGAFAICVLTLFVWMLDGFTYLDAVLVARDWEDAAGKVTDVKSQGRSNPNRYHFQFNVDGQTFSASSYSRAPVDGPSVAIKYDQNDPSVAYIVGTSRFHCLPIWSFGFGLMLVCVFLAFLVCVGHIVIPA